MTGTDKISISSWMIYVIIGVIIGAGTALFCNFAQYGLALAAAFLLCSLLIGIDPFNVIIFFIIWLPIQNFVLLCCGGFLGVPYPIVKGLLAGKEIIALMVLLYLLLIGKMRIARLRFVDYAFLLYFLWTSFYLMIPNNVFPIPGTMIGRVMGYRAAIVPIVLYFIGRWVPWKRRQLIFSLKLVIYIAVIAAIFGIFERFFLPDSFWVRAGITSYEALKGVIIPVGDLPPNFYSGFGVDYYYRRLASIYVGTLAFGFAYIFIVSLMFCFICYNRKIVIVKGHLQRLWIFVTILFAQALTLTRAAIIADVLAIGIFLLYLKKVKIKVILIALPFVLLLIFHPVSQQIYKHTFGGEHYGTYAHVRDIVIGYENVKSYPLGVGLGHGGAVGQTFAEGLAGENLYLAIAIERGIFGLVLFLLAIVALLWFCHRNLKKVKGDPLLELLAYVIIASTFGYVLASVTTEHWQAFVSSGIYWIFAGLTVQGIVKYRREGKI